ncbi:MAG: hypothetical protein J6A26_07090, partial [Oscillospiraceae bacterium]|nr:hypothetical protein [Oscillospiraceae bacterium]
MEHSTKINSLQILSVLLICRFFTMLVAVPNNRYTLEGGDSLLIRQLDAARYLVDVHDQIVSLDDRVGNSWIERFIRIALVLY